MSKRFTDAQKWLNTKRRILIEFNNKCFYCGIKLGLSTLNIDHFIPKSIGGSNKKSNLVAACSRCNQFKGNKHPKEFLIYILKRIAALSNQIKYYKRIIKIKLK